MQSPAYRNGLDDVGVPLMLQALVGTHSSKNEIQLSKRKHLPAGFEKPIAMPVSLEQDLMLSLANNVQGRKQRNRIKQK